MIHSIQFVVDVAGMILEGVCVLSLVLTGNWRRLPFVTIFLLYLCLSDCLLLCLHSNMYIISIYLSTTYGSYALEAAAIFNLWRIAGIRSWVAWLAICSSLIFAALFLRLSNVSVQTKSYDQRAFDHIVRLEHQFLSIDHKVAVARIVILAALLVLVAFNKKRLNCLVRVLVFAFSVYAIFGLIDYVAADMSIALRLREGTLALINLLSEITWAILLIVVSWSAFDFPIGIERPITSQC